MIISDKNTHSPIGTVTSITVYDVSGTMIQTDDLGDITNWQADPSSPSATFSHLAADRIVKTDSGKTLQSIEDLTNWLAGTSNQITVTDDGDGTITLSTPQDIDTSAEPEFDGVIFDNLGDHSGWEDGKVTNVNGFLYFDKEE